MIFNTDNPVTHTGQAALDFTAQSTLKLHGIDTGRIGHRRLERRRRQQPDR